MSYFMISSTESELLLSRNIIPKKHKHHTVTSLMLVYLTTLI